MPVGCRREYVFGDQDVLPDLEVEHACADEIGAVLESVLETLSRMDRPGGEDFERDPGCLHRLHELDGLFRGDRPDVVVIEQAAAVDVEVDALLLRRGGPVVAVMESLHVEVGLYTRLLDGDGHFERVAPDTGDQAILLDEIDGFAEQIDSAALDKAVSHAALDVGGDCSVVDRPLDVRRYVGCFGVDLCDPLDRSASFLPVLVEMARPSA